MWPDSRYLVVGLFSKFNFHFEVVVVHSQDEERDEVVVVFCVNTGRLLATFEGARESLLGGGGSFLSWWFSLPF